MIEFAALPTAFVVGAAMLFGLAIGSFLNVVIYRMPRGESLLRPGSHCPGCEAAVAPWDNIPLLSYLLLRGRCRRCKVAISSRYPAVEGLTGAAFAAVAWQYGPVAMMPALCLFAAALIAAALIDFDHQIIPDEISMGGLALALVVVPGVHAFTGQPFATALAVSAGGALLGGGTLWLLGFAHARVSTWSGRSFEHWPGPGELLPTPGSLDYWVWFPGMGLGDIKLLAMIGAVLGPLGVLETLLAASAAGLALGLAWAAATRSWNAPFGFGPAIAFGALLVVLMPGGLLRGVFQLGS
jgi:leader peptidase (prepilin peptidase)/N-methyltransferase